MTNPQPHDDPLAEGTGKVLQALALFTTVGESAARFAATAAQDRAAKAERRARTEQAADAMRRQAAQASQRAYAKQVKSDRHMMDKAFDETWLNTADLVATAKLWRTAATYALGGDRRAAEAMRRAQERLGTLHPGLIAAFEQHRASGMNLADAMHAAARDVWQQHAAGTPERTARPHGNVGAPPRALREKVFAIGTGPDPHGQRMVNELEAATRAEVARLADGIDPQILDRMQRQWRSAGHAPAANAAALLANAARQLRAEAHANGATVGTATIRHDVKDDHLTETASVEEAQVPVRTALAAYELAAQGFERAATVAQSALEDAESPPVGPTDQQRRFGRAFTPLGRIPSSPAHTPDPKINQISPAQRRSVSR